MCSLTIVPSLIFLAQMASLIASCKEKGAFVAEIRERKANNAIYAIREHASTFIIGSGTDAAKEGKWIWASDGKVFTDQRQKIRGVYSNWGQAPGNKSSAKDKSRNCMAMPQKDANAGKWIDAKCDGKRVACEAKVVEGDSFFVTNFDDLV